MKKTIKYVIVIVAFALATVSCHKEGKTAQDTKTFIKTEEDAMSVYLRMFKEKMENASKSEETLTMEDARWHLEAVLNFVYGDAGYQTTELQFDTFYYQMPTNSNSVTLAQLSGAFDTLSNEIEETCSNWNITNKSVLAIQIMFENDDKGDGVLVRAILCTRGFTHFESMWFDSTDYWNEMFIDLGGGFVCGGGKCGPYHGECPDSGAPLELTKKLNQRIPEYTCYSNRGGYFTDVVNGVVSIYSTDFGSPDYLYDENSPCDYKLYCRTGLANGTCICPDDMNYYLSKGPELISYYRPSGKVIISAFYQSSEIVGEKESNCFHELHLSYGVFHCDGNRE